MKERKFVITNTKKYHHVAPQVVTLFHLAVVVKWIIEQWLHPTNPAAAVWQFVHIYYCITLFVAGILFHAQFAILKEETVQLLNSGLQVEYGFNSGGGWDLNKK